MARVPKYGMAIEVDEKGNILRSIHDPNGALYVAVSEIQEEKGTLYIGCAKRPFIGKLPVSALPAVTPPSGGGKLSTLAMWSVLGALTLSLSLL